MGAVCGMQEREQNEQKMTAESEKWRLERSR